MPKTLTILLILFFSIPAFAVKPDSTTIQQDKQNRQTIMNFLEQYRIAYASRDTAQVRELVDKALKIYGNDDTNDKGKNYFKNLKRVFKTYKKINMKFENVKIYRHQKYTDFYGVNLKQIITASKKSKESFLFIMFDFTLKEEYNIHVLAEQPIKDSKGKIITKEENAYNLSDFEVLK